jgi:ribosomal protein S12 methylthiotransferase accessory factor
MVEAIDLEIHVPEGFPEKYRPALIRVADSCAVKKHLEHPPAFSIRTLVEGAAA